MENDLQTYTAFNGNKLLGHGPLDRVVLKVRDRLKEDPSASILIFSDMTGKQMDFDFRGSEKEILQRLTPFLTPALSRSASEPTASQTGPGRPKLGVISREVSLLPRHWEWLATQSAGASATLRRLIDEARKHSSTREKVKQSQERAYTFMSAIAGNLANYEEVLRALFAKNHKIFEEQMKSWPSDIRKHAVKLAEPAFDNSK